MFKQILVPIDLADLELAKPVDRNGGLARARLGRQSAPAQRPADDPGDAGRIRAARFRRAATQIGRGSLAIICKECGLDAARVSSTVRQGGIYHEVLEEAKAIGADLIVMSSHRPAMKTYFLGSNAGHVVRYAKCSVLVVRR